ncbi:MAG: CCA tRNA nucleotidyltransferase [Rhodospirillaceae bacterium]
MIAAESRLVIAVQPWMIADATRRVMAALVEARFVGGCVRDAVLALPASDIDIATPHQPAAVMERLQAAGLRVIPTGIKHGTVTALVDAAKFEITTLRRDVACHGRHAEIAFTDDWHVDAARRDFTINALSCTADGTLYDPFGGVADLKAGRVRFIGSAVDRICEDVLRLLRFFRFYARFGRGDADAEALTACRDLASLLPSLSAERVRSELLRLLAQSRCDEVWSMIAGCGILPHLLPTATRVPRLKTLVRLEHTLGLDGDERALVRLAALLETNGYSGRDDALAVAGRLRLSKIERKRLLSLVAPAVKLSPLDEPQWLRRALVALGDTDLFRDLLLLSAAEEEYDGGASLESISARLAWAERWRAGFCPVSGGDILALGVAAGPMVNEVLLQIAGWWADNEFAPGREACLNELARRLTPESLPPKAYL